MCLTNKLKSAMNILSFLFPEKNNPGKIGMVLSGGGVRGIAHLGVLKALNEKGIFPEILSGVSAGALAGIFYADGYHPEEIFEIFNKTSIFHFTKITIPNKGFLKMDKVSKILKEYIKAKTFEDLKIPLYVAVSNLSEGKVEYFNQGELINRIIASASIPVVFNPVLIQGKTYVDGGVFDNLPVYPIKDKCDFIIASHTNPLSKEVKLTNMLEIAERTFHLAIGSSVQDNSRLCDLFIEPDKLINYGMLKLENAKEIFNIGYDFTAKMLANKTSLNL